MGIRRKIEPEDVLGFKNVTDAQISPDGKLVAFVLGDSFTHNTRRPRSNIWVVSVDGGTPRRFTGGPRADISPRWSPDGHQLAFLSDRIEDERLQVYLLNRSGGEATQLTTAMGEIPASSRSINSISWSPDGRQIAFLRTEDDSEEERKRKDKKDDPIEFERNPKYTKIHTVNISSGVESIISPVGLQIWEFSWSPTCIELAVVCSDFPYEQNWYTCRLATIAIEKGEVSTLYSSKRQVAKPIWSPDGSEIAFLSSNWSDRGITSGNVLVVSKGGVVRNLSGNNTASTVALEWSDRNEELLTVAYERGGVSVTEINSGNGKHNSLWHGDTAVSDTSTVFSCDQSGNLAVVREDAYNPREVWLGKRKRSTIEWDRLTQLHSHAANIELGSTEQIYWRSTDGLQMQGFLVRPAGDGNGPYPLVTVVHGGPTGAHHNRFNAAFQWTQVLAAHGIATFLPNYRGSIGRGLEFAEANIGDMGGKDWEDILKGIDHCIEAGIGAPNRLGIAGGSYGGFMTAWAITQTSRFKAAVMIAGISDWRSFHGKSYLSGWDSIHYGDADPWDPDGVYKTFSPITYVKRVETPTLMLHGEDDEDVPVEQSYLFHRALKDIGVRTELVVYPREHHGFVEYNHILDSTNRITSWFTNLLLY